MTETVRIVSGMSALFKGVKAHFQALEPEDKVVVVFGYRERAKQQNQGQGGANRVIFLPGDPDGNGGELAATPRDVGNFEVTQIVDDEEQRVAEIRPLASWERQFTISIWGVDNDAQRDELAQAAAAEDLFEETLRAIEQFKGAGGPNIAWGRVKWTVAKENTFGTELLVACAIAHPLLDAPDEVTFPGFSLSRVGT